MFYMLESSSTDESALVSFTSFLALLELHQPDDIFKLCRAIDTKGDRRASIEKAQSSVTRCPLHNVMILRVLGILCVIVTACRVAERLINISDDV